MSSDVRVFIASSSEYLQVAETIRDLLGKCRNVEARVWNEGTFELSKTYIESLEKELERADFAVLALTPDDQATSRHRQQRVPRDNVLFELGLFMGRLGRERCYLVQQKGERLKVPSDLLGVQPAEYRMVKGRSLAQVLQGACAPILKHVEALGPRSRSDPTAVRKRNRVRSFCSRTEGAWWNRKITPKEHAIAFSRILPDEATHTVTIIGQSFKSDGSLGAEWKSVAVGIHADDRKILYSWEGSHPTDHPGEEFKGFGEIEFEDAKGKFRRGRGHFADIHLVHMKTTTWKSTDLRRVTRKEHERTMTEGSARERAELIGEVLEAW